ncbi:unnamed protein product [Arctogadus glacialis]
MHHALETRSKIKSMLKVVFLREGARGAQSLWTRDTPRFLQEVALNYKRNVKSGKRSFVIVGLTQASRLLCSSPGNTSSNPHPLLHPSSNHLRDAVAGSAVGTGLAAESSVYPVVAASLPYPAIALLADDIAPGFICREHLLPGQCACLEHGHTLYTADIGHLTDLPE